MAALFADEEPVEEFFTPTQRPATRASRPAAERPSHYKVISISMYVEDIERLDALVAALRARGHTRANKSMVIREALRQIDLDQVPGRR
jgi:hypothetical protein